MHAPEWTITSLLITGIVAVVGALVFIYKTSRAREDRAIAEREKRHQDDREAAEKRHREERDHQRAEREKALEIVFESFQNVEKAVRADYDRMQGEYRADIQRLNDKIEKISNKVARLEAKAT